MYANAQNMLFSHMWLIMVSNVSGCHGIGMEAFEETKSRIFFQDQHPYLNVKSKCMHGWEV